MQIRIINTPPGEAPESVRQAWIGLVLPVPDQFNRLKKFPVIGVMSGPRNAFSTLIALLLGRVEWQAGYAVAADAAIEILSRHAPEAANWWRQNVPRSIAPGKHFVFAESACVVIYDSVG